MVKTTKWWDEDIMEAIRGKLDDQSGQIISIEEKEDMILVEEITKLKAQVKELIILLPL